jgi:putative FmdB family regulatory protein
MPRYSYICQNCENQVEAFHSSDERLSFCDICQTDSLKKVISMPTIVKKNDVNPSTNRKTGDIVKEKIEEFRQNLKEQKKDLLRNKI